MAEKPGLSLHVDTRQFDRNVRRLSLITGKDVADEHEKQIGLALKTIISATPPGSPSIKGTAAKRQGEEAIERDFYRLFVPVRLKRKRPEKHPDLKSVHRRHFREARGRRIRSDRGRQKYYVSRVKHNRLLREKKRNVGRLAANWLPAYYRLRGRSGVAAWIRRHSGSRGGVTVRRLRGGRNGSRVVAYNDAPTEAGRRTLRATDRAAKWGLTLQARKIERQIPHIIRKAARKSGYQAT